MEVHCEPRYNWRDFENVSMRSRQGLLETYQTVAGFSTVWQGHLRTIGFRLSVAGERCTRDGSDGLGGPSLELVWGVRTTGVGDMLCPVDIYIEGTCILLNFSLIRLSMSSMDKYTERPYRVSHNVDKTLSNVIMHNTYTIYDINPTFFCGCPCSELNLFLMS